MGLSRNTLIFMLLCAIWGTTWIGIKAGIATVPPLMFAGTRFTTAGAVLWLIAHRGAGGCRIARADLPRTAIASLLMISLCYGALFWGMQHVDSGTAAVLEMSLTPIALMGFALLLGEERFDRRRAGAIALGVLGLLALFGPTAWAAWTTAGGWLAVAGAAAVSGAALAYGWGAVLARPLLRRYPSGVVAGATTLIGGLVLMVLSLALEPGAIEALSGRWGWAAWSGWLFLVLFGSLIGYSVYMRLLRDIGPTRSGAYAFVSPVIAVALGIAVFGETAGPIDIAAMIVMLVAAWLAMAGQEQAGRP